MFDSGLPEVRASLLARAAGGQGRTTPAKAGSNVPLPKQGRTLFQQAGVE